MLVEEGICKVESGDAHIGHASLCIREPGVVKSTTRLKQAMILLSWLCPHLWKNTPHTTLHKETTDT